MSSRIEIQVATSAGDVPARSLIRRWVRATLRAVDFGAADLTVRIVDEAEIRDLNRRYRDRDRATDVLSFPFEDPPGIETTILGDVVVCAQVVTQVARDRSLAVDAHWAHIVVHGVLHLCGHDHVADADAMRMQALETAVLAELGIPDPYGQTPTCCGPSAASAPVR